MEKELFAKDQEKSSALAAKGQLEFDLKTKNEEIKRLNTVCILTFHGMQQLYTEYCLRHRVLFLFCSAVVILMSYIYSSIATNVKVSTITSPCSFL